jgi:hypothetical protein
MKKEDQPMMLARKDENWTYLSQSRIRRRQAIGSAATERDREEENQFGESSVAA